MSADAFEARVRAFVDGLQELTARTGIVAGFTTGHCSCCNNDGSEDGIQLSEAEGPGEYVGDDSRLAWMSVRELEEQKKREARAEKARERRRALKAQRDGGA